EKIDKERLAAKVTIKKDELHIPAGPDMKFIMGYKIDASKSPSAIDMDIKDGPVKEGKAVGIIALDGDTLKLCYDPMGVTRPTKFESTKDNGAFSFVLKRANCPASAVPAGRAAGGHERRHLLLEVRERHRPGRSGPRPTPLPRAGP